MWWRRSSRPPRRRPSRTPAIEAALEETVVEAVQDAAAIEAASDAAIEESFEEKMYEAVDAGLEGEALEDAVEQAAADADVQEAIADAVIVEALEETVEEAVEDAKAVEALSDAAILSDLADEVESIAADVEATEEAEATPRRPRRPRGRSDRRGRADPEAHARREEEHEGREGRRRCRGGGGGRRRPRARSVPGPRRLVRRAHVRRATRTRSRRNLESRIHTMQMEDKIFDVHIPMEDVMEIKGGKKQVVQQKVFPGYLLVKMVYDNDSWYVVRNTPGRDRVRRRRHRAPSPRRCRGARSRRSSSVKKEEVKPQFRLGFEEGDVVRIISGPFADFNGTISEINVDQSKLKVLVNIFDRETPVELAFDQVAKV